MKSLGLSQNWPQADKERSFYLRSTEYRLEIDHIKIFVYKMEKNQFKSLSKTVQNMNGKKYISALSHINNVKTVCYIKARN